MSVTRSALKAYHNLYQNSNSLFLQIWRIPPSNSYGVGKPKEKKKKILKMRTKLKDSHLLISKLTKKLQ